MSEHLITHEEAIRAGIRGSSSVDPSGAAAAQAAHDAGAVIPVAVRPMHDATLSLRLHGDGDDVRELLDTVALLLSGHPSVVPPVTVSVVGR